MKKSALILGGGIAGLAAARDLARRGMPVTVLEAQSRLGGRIRTLAAGGVPVELGAEFIHGESQPLLQTIQEAGLSTQPVTGKNAVRDGARRRPAHLWKLAGEVFKRINPEEPDASFEAFLARQAGLEDGARNLARHFVEGFNAARADRISSHALLRAERAAGQMNGSRQSRLTAGYSALVDFLAGEIQRLGGVLLTNACVQQVSWKHEQVNVLVEHNHHGELFNATAAVVALPLGILRSGEVTFQPPLPDKFEAARGLEFGNVVKIIFEFDQAFWGDSGFVHALDQAIPTWWSDPRGPLLTGWAAGPHADALLGHSHAELEQTGIEIAGRIFSVPRETLRRRLVASHYWNWTGDPWIRGAYSYIPVNGLDLPRRLAAPVAGTLFFAGEATVADAQMGTVFGALESGLRAAREIPGS